MKRIFVGNVDFSITKAQLRSLFMPCGSVESVSLVTARDTGQSCACGFIEMLDSTAGDNAIATLNGRDTCGHPLIVTEVRPKAAELGRSSGSGSDGSRAKAPGASRW